MELFLRQTVFKRCTAKHRFWNDDIRPMEFVDVESVMTKHGIVPLYKQKVGSGYRTDDRPIINDTSTATYILSGEALEKFCDFASMKDGF